MLTKKYKNGFITLNAEKFSPVAQETIDEESGLSHCPNCGDSKYILFGDKLCVECGQALDWE